jgi:hypothetical protein
MMWSPWSMISERLTHIPSRCCEKKGSQIPHSWCHSEFILAHWSPWFKKYSHQFIAGLRIEQINASRLYSKPTKHLPFEFIRSHLPKSYACKYCNIFLMGFPSSCQVLVIQVILPICCLIYVESCNSFSFHLPWWPIECRTNLNKQRDNRATMHQSSIHVNYRWLYGLYASSTVKLQ